MDMSLANEHCRHLATSLRGHLAALEPDIGRMKADIAAEIDAECDCDNCVGLSLTIEGADALLNHMHQLIDWLEIPISPSIEE